MTLRGVLPSAPSAAVAEELSVTFDTLASPAGDRVDPFAVDATPAGLSDGLVVSPVAGWMPYGYVLSNPFRARPIGVRPPI